MANQLYGSSSYVHGGGSNSSSLYPSRLIPEPYVPTDPSHPTSSRYLGSDPVSYSSNLYSHYGRDSSSMIYNHKDTVGGGYTSATRMAGGGGWPGPPRVGDVGVSATSVDPLYAGYKRLASEALYHQPYLGTHEQSEAWNSSNPLIKRSRFENTSSLPLYPQRHGQKDNAHYMPSRTNEMSTTQEDSANAKLNGKNFVEWFRYLRVVLGREQKLYVLDQPPPSAPGKNASQAVQDSYDKYLRDSLTVGRLMLSSMTPELLKDHENMTAWDMISSLKTMFGRYVMQERFDIVKSLRHFTMPDGSSVSEHVLKMKGYIDRLERLGFPLPREVGVDFVINSLPKSYKIFVVKYKLSGIDKTLDEIHDMLKIAEQEVVNTVVKPKKILTIKGKAKIDNKSKNKGIIIGQAKAKAEVEVEAGSSIKKPKKETKGKVPEDAICFECSKIGHWKRNCPVYLATKAGPTGTKN